MSPEGFAFPSSMRRSGEALDRDRVASLPLVFDRGLDADRAKQDRRGVRSREVFLGKGVPPNLNLRQDWAKEVTSSS